MDRPSFDYLSLYNEQFTMYWRNDCTACRRGEVDGIRLEHPRYPRLGKALPTPDLARANWVETTLHVKHVAAILNGMILARDDGID